jgi:hypothetical protein
LSPGDFDGDGVPDLVVIMANHHLVIHQTQRGDITIERELATSPRHVTIELNPGAPTI